MTKSARCSSLPASCLQNFSCVLLKGNYATFLVQFRIYLHSWAFQKAEIVFTLRAHAILILSEKFTCPNKFPIELEVV